MSSILSFIRKDLRLLLWPWLGWMTLLAGKIALGLWCVFTTRFSASDKATFERLDATLTILVVVACYILVLRLVQADCLLRPQALWRTRPITGGQLLIAKASAASLLFGLAPTLLALPWWLFNGFAGDDLAFAALELLLRQAVIIVPAFLIASVVDSFSRAILWSFVQYCVFVVIGFYASPSSDSLHDLELGLAPSRELLAAGVVLLALPALVVWQFRQRRTIMVISGLVAAQLAAALIWKYSPYNFIPRARPSGWNQLNAERFTKVALGPGGEAEYQKHKYRGPGAEKVLIKQHWPLTGLPPGLASQVDLTSFVLGEGATALFTISNPFATPSFRVPLLEALQDKQADRPPQNDPTDASSIFTYFYLPLEQTGRLKVHPPTVSATLRLQLFRPEVTQNLPLVPGIRYTDRHGGLCITDIESTTSDIRLSFSATRPGSFLRSYWSYRYRRHRSSEFYRYNTWPIEDKIYDPGTGQIREINVGGEHFIMGVAIQRGNFVHNPYPVFRDGVWGPWETDLTAWRSRLKVIRILYHEEGRILLQGRAEKLVVSGSPSNSVDP